MSGEKEEAEPEARKKREASPEAQYCCEWECRYNQTVLGRMLGLLCSHDLLIIVTLLINFTF